MSISRSATYKGRAIEVDVDLLHDHSHIVVAVRGAQTCRPSWLEEVITEHADAGEALDAGLRIGRILIDEQLLQ